MKKIAILFVFVFLAATTKSLAVHVVINDKAFWSCLSGCNRDAGICAMIGNDAAEINLGTQAQTLTVYVPKASGVYEEMLHDNFINFIQDSQLNPEVAAALGIPQTTQIWFYAGDYIINVDPVDGSLSATLYYYQVQ